jgi:hypothetical protein
MGFTNPAVADFKTQFTRDFPFGTDPNTSVLDSDITRAFIQVNVNINPCLFADQGTYSLAYLLLTAHYLVMNLRSSSQGLNGQFSWLNASRGVGQVNESFTIPQRILDNPTFSMLTKTNYGAQYLDLVLPMLSGAFGIAPGHTQAI